MHMLHAPACSPHPPPPLISVRAQVLDALGNANNVLHVPPRPPILTSKERLERARHFALLTALGTKMGVLE